MTEAREPPMSQEEICCQLNSDEGDFFFAAMRESPPSKARESLIIPIYHKKRNESTVPYQRLNENRRIQKGNSWSLRNLGDDFLVGRLGFRLKRTSLVNYQVSALKFFGIEHFNGFLSLGLTCHFYETKTFGTTGIFILDDYGVGDGTGLREKFS